MNMIRSEAELDQLYGQPKALTNAKVVDHITPLYKRWIEASHFLVLASVGPEGTDLSPRGDDGPVVLIADNKTLLLPDWLGNNRIDSLRNIVRDGRVSLMFMVPGCNNVVRLNGTAMISADQSVTDRFLRNGKRPRSVIVISATEMYFQCAKALMRSRLWTTEDRSASVPTAGDFLREVKSDFDAAEYDSGYPEYARTRMW